MNQSFALEIDELLSKSREIAIDLGYDYISTIHLLLADCEIKSETSLLNFAFPTQEAYMKFKKDYTLSRVDLLNNLEESLPLTKEAELVLRSADLERASYRQRWIYPCHIFLAALKDKESLFSGCFRSDPEALEKLVQYYSQHRAFDDSKLKALKDPGGKSKNLRSIFSNLFQRKK